MIKFCSKYVFQYKIEYGIYFLLGIILCGLNTFIPAAMGQFINMFNVETTYSAMLKFIFLLLLLYVGKEIVCYVNKILYIRIQTNAAFSLNFEIVNHLKKVSYNLIYDLENGFDCFYSYNVFISTLFFYIYWLQKAYL